MPRAATHLRDSVKINFHRGQHNNAEQERLLPQWGMVSQHVPHAQKVNNIKGKYKSNLPLYISCWRAGRGEGGVLWGKDYHCSLLTVPGLRDGGHQSGMERIANGDLVAISALSPLSGNNVEKNSQWDKTQKLFQPHQIKAEAFSARRGKNGLSKICQRLLL